MHGHDILDTNGDWEHTDEKLIKKDYDECVKLEYGDGDFNFYLCRDYDDKQDYIIRTKD